MSNWSYIQGTITASPIGRTQAQKRYILDTVLAHLPIVSGSEKDMDVYVIQKNDIIVPVLVMNLEKEQIILLIGMAIEQEVEGCCIHKMNTS